MANTQILGTIISSVLDYEQLKKTYNAFDDKKPIYVPCDGRTIEGSDLFVLTQKAMKNAPDLRGKFLRGLNSFSDDGQIIDPTNADPDSTRKVGSYQGDAFKAHEHSYNAVAGIAGSVGGPPGMYAGAITSGTTSSNVKDTETRPKNISVYFYLKIN